MTRNYGMLRLHFYYEFKVSSNLLDHCFGKESSWSTFHTVVMEVSVICTQKYLLYPVCGSFCARHLITVFYGYMDLQNKGFKAH